jgi:hypothetical protein
LEYIHDIEYVEKRVCQKVRLLFSLCIWDFFSFSETENVPTGNNCELPNLWWGPIKRQAVIATCFFFILHTDCFVIIALLYILQVVEINLSYWLFTSETSQFSCIGLLFNVVSGSSSVLGLSMLFFTFLPR